MRGAMSQIGPERHFVAAWQFGRFRRIVLQNTAAFFSWADLRIAQLVAFSADSVLRHYRPTSLADRLRRTGDCGRWRRAAEELDEAPQVLSGCGQ